MKDEGRELVWMRFRCGSDLMVDVQLVVFPCLERLIHPRVTLDRVVGQDGTPATPTRSISAHAHTPHTHTHCTHTYTHTLYKIGRAHV